MTEKQVIIGAVSSSVLLIIGSVGCILNLHLWGIPILIGIAVRPYLSNRKEDDTDNE